MNRIYALVICCLLTIPFYGQKDTLSISLNYKAKGYNSKEAVAISNSKNGELVVLIEDKKETILQLIDEKGQLSKELKTDRLGTYLVNFLGHHYFDDGTYAIVFSDTRKMKFSALKFSFESEKVEQVTLNFKLQKEKYVESITQNNTFYLMTAQRRSDNVNFYELNSENSFNKNTVSFDFISSVSSQGFKSYPIDVLTARALGSGSLAKIDPNSPSSIQTTSGVNKLYQFDNELVFSFDKEEVLTKIIRLNLSDFSLKTSVFKKPILESNEGGVSYMVSHNSYINDSIIFQLAVSKKQMKFAAKNFSNNEILKEIHLKQDDSITFKNGPIILEKTGDAAMFSAAERQLEKTSKFLRKVSSAKAGITAMDVGGKLQLTIGGYTEVRSAGAPMMMGGFGAVGAATFVMANAAFNPTYYAYSSYSSSKSTYINCIFDDQFNHLNGEIQNNVFDNINDYEDYFKEHHEIDLQQANGSAYITPARMRLKNVFYHNGNHYLGYLNTVDRNYHLVKF